MADLSVMIRLYEHELDEKRRALADVYTALAELEKKRRALERAFEAEKQALRAGGDIGFTFAPYAEKVREDHRKIELAEAGLEKQAQIVRDSMMETFSELKKFEMTQERREKLEEEERLLKETRNMDEIGIEGFRRRE